MAAILEAGVALVECLGAVSRTQNQAVKEISRRYVVQRRLAERWLAEFAARVTRPLFALDDDDQVPHTRPSA